MKPKQAKEITMSESKNAPKKVDKKKVDAKTNGKELDDKELNEATGGAEYVRSAKSVEQWKWDPMVVNWRMRDK